MASSKIKKSGFGTLSLALLTAVMAACAPPQTAETEPQVGEPTAEETIDPGAADAGDVADDYEQLIGQTVTIRGDIDEQLSDNVVRLTADEGLFGGENIMVVLPDDFVLPTEEGGEDVVANRIQVTGEVQRFTAAEAQQYNLQDEVAEDEERPLIVAETAALSPDAGELSDNPEQFYNQTVAIESDDLEEIAPNTYRMGGGLTGGDILVLSEQPLQELIDQGEELVITGEARQFDLAEFQEQYNWDAEQQQEIAENYADGPVIVAQEVFPVTEGQQ
ncbi:hypothetical protein C7B61_16215 [filamentous cyanobacterium CCP1]|nr:hypothetical protein C7B76_10840 [filamentous cyanobacterium CCP2]PSB61237.1 hypothetical protein C7B61_16215 [filamentous cyanobacterium CCP1]